MGLAGAAVSLAGQFLDRILGNPFVTSSIRVDDDIFSALGQAVSLAGTSVFLVCILSLWWRSGCPFPRQ